MQLRDHLVDLTRSCPDASLSEIAQAFDQTIDEAFREALQELELPAPLSPAQRKLEEYRLQRFPSGSRHLRKRRIDERDVFLESLRHLKLQVNGRSSGKDDFGPPAGFDGSNNFPIWTSLKRSFVTAPGAVSYRVPHETTERLPRDRMLDPNLVDLTIRERILGGEAIPEITVAEPRVQVSSELEARIPSDRAVSEVITRIEAITREFRDLSPPYGFVYVDWVRDIEYPEWEKMVIELVPSNGSFEERLQLWESYDNALRKEIKQAIRDLDREQKIRLRRLSESIFVHMQLSEA